MATKRKSTKKTKKVQLTPAERLAPPAEGKFVTYDRECGDFAAFLDGQYLGSRDTRDEAQSLVNGVYYEQLTHTQSGLEVERSVVEVVAESLEDLPLPLPAGRVTELEIDALQDAFVTALAKPELQERRWETALTRAYIHLSNNPFAEISPDGKSYIWYPDEPTGGEYQVSTTTCQCVAFVKGCPCKHRAAAIVLSLYQMAEEENASGYIFLYVFRGLSTKKAA